MTKKFIDKKIHQELQYFLDEYDVSAEIKRLTNNKRLDKIIKEELKKQIESSVTDAFLKAFVQNKRFIDSFAENKLQNLLKELGVK